MIAKPRRPMHLALRAMLAAVVLLFALPAAAQEAPAQPVSVEELERLVQTLESEAERQRLLGQLRALIEAQRAGTAEKEMGFGAGLLARLSERMEDLSGQLLLAAGAVSDVPKVAEWVREQASNDVARARWIEVLGKLFLLLLAGVVVERIAAMGLAGMRHAVLNRRAESPVVRVPLILAFILIALVPLGAFAATAYGLMTILHINGEVRIAALVIVTAYLIVRATMVVAQALFMPGVPGMRLLPLDDETAHYLFIWARRLTHVTAYGYFAAEAARLLGMPQGGFSLALKVLGLVITTMLVILILQNRHAIAGRIRAGRGGMGRHMRTLRNRLADVWHVLAALYVVGIYAVWALKVEGGFDYILRASLLTVVILLLSGAASTLLQRLINRAFAVSEQLRAEFPQLEARANRYLPILHGVLKGAVAVVTAMALLQAWGIDTLAWLASETGQRIAGSLFSIVFVLVAALVAWELVSSAIERYLAQTDGNGEKVERSARVRTLLPLLRNVIMVLLAVMVTLIVLSELGLNIAPLLAGAGVVGLAIGFGSQKLVQDLITGVFILIEDSISVGDVVRVGEHSGVVEAMSIRSIRLRDLNGSVHTLPFSSVGTIVNLTKEFSFYVMDIGVAYREDTDEVSEVLKRIGAEMQADPEYGPLIIEPLEVLGVDRFADSAVIIRARIKTKPIKQWLVGREFNRRMKRRFDELGIEIPFPHTTVYFGEDKKGRAPPAHLRVAREEAGS